MNAGIWSFQLLAICVSAVCIICMCIKLHGSARLSRARAHIVELLWWWLLFLSYFCRRYVWHALSHWPNLVPNIVSIVSHLKFDNVGGSINYGAHRDSTVIQVLAIARQSVLIQPTASQSIVWFLNLSNSILSRNKKKEKKNGIHHG